MCLLVCFIGRESNSVLISQWNNLIWKKEGGGIRGWSLVPGAVTTGLGRRCSTWALAQVGSWKEGLLSSDGSFSI